jgi:twinfilin-like protein
MDQFGKALPFSHLSFTYVTADVPSNVQDAFKAFTSDNSLLALPLSLQGATLQTSRAIQCKDAGHTSQISLSILEDVLSPTRSLYIMLRRNDSIFAITFVPYRAAQDERNSYLQYRYDLVKLLGQEHFESSFICKEIGEITDARSWTEREQGQGEAPDPDHVDACCDPQQSDGGGVEDFGYKKNKCRLCDRRMKNKITDEALAALRKLEDEKTLVQMACPNHQFAYGLG